MTITELVENNPSFIGTQTPRFIGLQSGTVIDIGIEYGPMTGGRAHRLNYLSEISFPLSTAADATEPVAPASESFNPNSTIQLLTENAGRAARNIEGNSLVMPDFYQNDTLVINTSTFGSIVSQMFGYHVRRIISKKWMFKKVKVDVLDPPVTVGEGSIPLAARRRTENYSFICPNGFTGLADGEPNERALCFSRYCGSSSTEARRISSIIDRPSRLLIRGCSINENELFENGSIAGLITALITPTIVNNVNNRNITFTPKENVSNDLREIRAVQCVGFTRVAGQGGRDRQREMSELEYLRRRVIEGQPITESSRKPASNETREGGNR